MLFIKRLFSAFLAASLPIISAISPGSGTTAPPGLPFNFTHLFTAHLTLARPLPPIAVPGGVLITEPIAGGTVEGPYINGTLQGGIVTPSIYDNATLQVPTIQAWGITSDGAAFVINEAGIGTTRAQVTRIQLSIGGGDKYAGLRNGFVLATVNPNANQTEVTVHGYRVEDITTFS